MQANKVNNWPSMFKRIDRIFNAGNPVPYAVGQIATSIVLIWALFQGYHWGWWVAAVIVQQLTVGLGISVGYHRYFCHNAFEVKWKPLEWIFSALAIWTMAGSPTGFSIVHLAHHKYADKDGDPHGAGLGWRIFSAAHAYLTPEALTLGPNGMRKRAKKSSINLVAIHKWFWLWCMIPPAIMSAVSLAYGSWEPLLFLWFIPSWMRFWCGPFSAWYSHRKTKGRRTADTDDDSVDTWLIGFSIWEGPHNYHHAHAGDWDFRAKWYDWDPGAWFLILFEKMGWVKLRDYRRKETKNV